MCGRYALHHHPDVVALAFGLAEAPQFSARYNIAPMSSVPIVRADAQGERQAVTVRWGLLPRWAKDPKLAAKMNNARAETVAEKPSFREAYRRRRCLLPASGFYEWHAEGGRKQPWYIHPRGAELFGFAALWERWQGPEGPLETCAIITTEANEVMRPIHDRMPVILEPANFARWIDCRPDNDVAGLLRPCDPAMLDALKVSTAVNNARNESPVLIEPTAA
jgi:putative SOS response-associated peptidase YedK